MIEAFNSITKYIKDSNAIVIMAHKGIDLDALGSAVCMYRIVESFEKQVSIYINPELENKSVQKSVDILKDLNIKFINDITNEDLVIILDTNKEQLVENSEAIKNIKTIVIDHHIQSGNTLKAMYTYINTEVSSAVEIVTTYLKYLNKEVEPNIATIMLAGLEIDTNSFNIKTSEHTYETAATLAKLGADNILKKKILKEDKDNYCQRQEFVKNSDMFNDNMALCVMDNNIYKKYMLALISEDLLRFDKVDASFTIGYIGENTVAVSARSIGDIDVEKIMYQLGGGGHKTDAACQIENTNLLEVKEKLLKVIKDGEL